MIYAGDWGFVYTLTTNVNTHNPSILQIELFLIMPNRKHKKRVFTLAQLLALPPQTLIWEFQQGDIPAHLPGQYGFEAYVTYAENPATPTVATAGRSSSPWTFEVRQTLRYGTTQLLP